MSHVSLLDERFARLGAFALSFLLLAVWERVSAFGGRYAPRSPRWPANIGLAAIDILILRALLPAGVVGIAVVAAHFKVGLLNMIAMPGLLAVICGLFVLDIVIYWQHRVFHLVPWLWRFHRVHHADPELDVTTALRFHPAEAVLSMGLKGAVVLAFGLPPISVLIFEITLNAAAMFNHTSATLPGGIERCVNWVLVTPNMHRVHHSTHWSEANRNFGFSVSWWDRIFGTFRAPPDRSCTASVVGLPDGPAVATHVQLVGVLQMPWVRRSA